MTTNNNDVKTFSSFAGLANVQAIYDNKTLHTNGINIIETFDAKASKYESTLSGFVKVTDKFGHVYENNADDVIRSIRNISELMRKEPAKNWHTAASKTGEAKAKQEITVSTASALTAQQYLEHNSVVEPDKALFEKELKKLSEFTLDAVIELFNSTCKYTLPTDKMSTYERMVAMESKILDLAALGMVFGQDSHYLNGAKIARYRAEIPQATMVENSGAIMAIISKQDIKPLINADYSVTLSLVFSLQGYDEAL